jgi:hypothetical protein
MWVKEYETWAPSVIPAARAKVQLEWPRGWNLLVGQKERFEAQVSFLLFFYFYFLFSFIPNPFEFKF